MGRAALPVRAERMVIVAALLLAGACVREDRPALYESEVLVQELLAAREAADTLALLDLFAPTAVYDDFQNQIQYQGIDEVAAYAMSLHAWAGDLLINVVRVQAGPDAAAAEWVLSAVQERPMGDFMPQATGREVVLNGVTLIEVAGGRIVRAADYLDALPLVLQLGGRVEYPGGAVLELEDVR